MDDDDDIEFELHVDTSSDPLKTLLRRETPCESDSCNRCSQVTGCYPNRTAPQQPVHITRPTGRVRSLPISQPTVKDQIMSATQINSSFIYFDLMDSIDLMSNDKLKGRILGSVAWSIDAQILSTTRAMFWDAFKLARVSDDPVANLDDFINIVKERIQGELTTLDFGFDEGMLTTARKLLWLRDSYHEKAVQYDLGYKPLTLEELIERERPEEIKGDAKANLKTLAEFAAEDDKEVATTMEQMLIDQAERRALENFETRKLINPLICMVLRFLTPIEAQFYELNIDAQRRCIDATKRSIDRALPDLARRSSPMDFAFMVREGLALRKELDKVLCAPKFTGDEGGTTMSTHNDTLVEQAVKKHVRENDDYVEGSAEAKTQRVAARADINRRQV